MECGCNDVLKSFSNNLNIWIISRLTLLSFLLGLGHIFLVFSMPSNMGLYPGHFEYYVMNHWVILNPLRKLVSPPPCFSVSAGNQSGWFQLTSALSHFLWLVVPMSKVLKSLYLGLPCTCTLRGQSGTHVVLYIVIQFSKLLWVYCTHMCKVSWGWDQDLYWSITELEDSHLVFSSWAPFP